MRKFKCLQRFFSIILVIIFVLSSIPLTASAQGNVLPFKDVHSNDWFYEAVKFVYEEGIMLGTTETEFSPNVNLTRAQLVVILYRLQGEPSVAGLNSPFTDVPQDSWFADAIIWAYGEDIVGGIGNDLFGPNNDITREQVAAILDRFTHACYSDKYSEIEAGDLDIFLDRDTVSEWATESLKMAVGVGIINGYPETNGYTIRPKNSTTRAEIAQMLMALIGYLNNLDGKKLTIQLYGPGKVQVTRHSKTSNEEKKNIFTEEKKANIVRVEAGQDVDITFTVADDVDYEIETKDKYDVFISYFVDDFDADNADENKPVYLGYNNEAKKDYTGWYKYTHTIKEMNKDHLIRVYFIKKDKDVFIKKGEDETLVRNSTPTSHDYVNYSDRIDFEFFAEILGENKSEEIFKKEDAKFTYNNGVPSIKSIPVNGRCFGISATTQLISQPWESGIKAADFSRGKEGLDYLSYTIPQMIKMDDVASVASIYDNKDYSYMSLEDMIDTLQALAFSDQYFDGIMELISQKVDPQDIIRDIAGNIIEYRNIKTISNNNNWGSFFGTLDAYARYHTSPINIKISGGATTSAGITAGAHAVAATGYEYNSSTREVQISIRDPNGSSGGASSISAINTSTAIDSWEITSYNYVKHSDYRRMSYLPFYSLIDLWENRESKKTSTPTTETPLLAHIEIDNNDLNGLVFSNSSGKSAVFALNTMSTDIDGASLIEEIGADGYIEDFSNILVWLPEDTYTITNTKNEILTVTMVDDFASVKVSIEPSVTAKISVSDTYVEDCRVEFISSSPASGSVEMNFREEVNTEFNTMRVNGAIIDGNAVVQKSASGMTVEGFETLETTREDMEGGIIQNYRSDLSGQQADIDGVTAVIAIPFEEIPQLQTPSNLSLANGVAYWDNNADVVGYKVQPLLDGIPLSDWLDINTNSCDIGDANSFAVYVLGDDILQLDSPIAIYVKPRQELDIPTGLSFDRGIAAWNNVDNASYYRIGLYEDGNLVTYLKGTADCYYDYSAYMQNKNASYTFSVQAMTLIEEEYKESAVVMSEPSTPLTSSLSAPAKATLYQGAAQWTAVENATGYELILYCNDTEIRSSIITGNTSINLNPLPKNGTYFFAVKALGDNVVSNDSGYTLSNSYYYTPILDDDDVNLFYDLLGSNDFIEKYGNLGNNTVDLTNGNFVWQYIDLESFGAKPLTWKGTYNSLDEYNGALGYNWRHSFLFYIVDRARSAEVYFPDGAKLIFRLGEDGEYVAPIGTEYRLRKDNSGFALSGLDKTLYRFDGTGKILYFTNVHGETTSYTYNGDHLIAVTNGKCKLSFSYFDDRIVSVTDGTDKKVMYQYDGNGNLVKMTNSDGDSLVYSYDGSHNLISIIDFNGSAYIKNTYDDMNRVKSQTFEGEGPTKFSYDTENRESIKTDANGLVTTYYYNEYQRITRISDFESGTSNIFDADGRLSSTTGRVGQITSYVYDSYGNTIQIIHPDGTSEHFEYNDLNLVTKATAKDKTFTLYDYDERGNLTVFTDARGNKNYYTYDNGNNLLTITDALGNKINFTYDSKGNVLTKTDPLKNVTKYAYDNQGRLVLQTNADGGKIVYEYSMTGKLIKTIDPDGNVSEIMVNGNGYDTGKTDPMGFLTATVYNERNKPITVIDAEDNTTTYDYDEMGQRISITDALKNTINYTYDLLGRMTAMTDARGNTWTYSYNAEGRMTVETDPLGNTISKEYDSMGRTTASTNARNAKTGYEYDAVGRIVRTKDALSNSSRNIYDENGNIIEQYDKNDNKWSYTYDANNRLVETKDPLGYVTTYIYDANGRQTKTVSSLESQNQYVYDSMGRLIKAIDPENNETVYKYDILGRLVQVIYADGTFASNKYDANGRLISAVAQDGGIIDYTYNKNGQILTITDALKDVTSYVYDELGRTQSVTDALNGKTSYTYDKNSNLLSVTDPLGGVTSYEYDALNRVISTTDALGNVSRVGYDANGNINKATSADGGVITYNYDLLDRLTSYTDSEGYTFSFAYDANGNTIRSIDGRGNATASEFDGLNRAVKQIDQLGNFTSVIYDADGRIIQAVNAEGAETNYIYDKNGNITKVTDALGNATMITYDSMNRVSKMIDALGAVSAYTYTATGNVKTITDALNGVKSYEYDLLGNLVKETNELGNSIYYTFDALSRPLTITNSLGEIDRFEYDANSRITKVTDKNGNSTHYVYDGNGNIIETIDALGHSSYFEYDAMNRLIKVTLYRIDSRHKVNEAQVTLYQYDKRGLVTQEINAEKDGTVFIYDGNGNLIQKSDPDGYVTEYSYDPRNLVNAINYSSDVGDGYNDGGNGNVSEPMTLSVTATMSGNDVTVTVKNGAAVIATKIVSFAKNTTQTYDVSGYTVEVVYNGGGVKSANIIGGTINNSSGNNGNSVGGNNGNSASAVGKEVQFAYNKNGELIAMMDWNGTVNFELDLLDRIKSVNDHNEQITAYTYDSIGNKTSIKYPDNTLATYTYDLLDRLITLTDAEGQDTVYTYDAASQLISQSRPNGWDETYQYDPAGQLLRQYTTDPSNEQNKAIEWLYSYDPEGNILTEYRDGELKKFGLDSSRHGMERYNLTHTYDALNRLTSTTGDQGYKAHVYTYDSLGNLTYEIIGNSKSADYQYNILNQLVKRIDDGKDNYTYNYDKRGNQIIEVYNKNLNNPQQDEIVATYVYDATNRMVKGTNADNEQSFYIYNGLGHLIGNEWIAHKNAYGYTDVNSSLSPQVNGVIVCDRHSHTDGNGHINPTGKGHTDGGTTGGITPVIDNKKFSAIHKDYVLDYTSPLKNAIIETESGVGGLTYRYVYGLERVETAIYGIPNGVGKLMQNDIVKLYYHQDYLGTTNFLTDNVDGKVTSYVSYDDWGSMTAKAVLKVGVRELDLVQDYSGHPADMVLDAYYTKARIYDAQDRRFMAEDQTPGNLVVPMSFNKYAYALNNPTKRACSLDGSVFELHDAIIGRVYEIVNNTSKNETRIGYQFYNSGRVYFISIN